MEAKENMIDLAMNVIKSMKPLEVLEICGLDEDSEALVDALVDHIRDNEASILHQISTEFLV